MKSPVRAIPFIPVLYWAGMSVSCTNDMDRVAAIEVQAGAPDRTTMGAEYHFTDSGRVRNVLRAGRIEEYKGEPGHTVIEQGLELEFYGRDGAQNSVLTARRGLILPAQRRMQVFDEVVFVNAKGERLETEALTWEQDSAKVFTDKAVRIVKGPDVIYGQGLEADEDFNRYRIHKVTGEILVDEEEAGTLGPDAQAE